MPAKEDFDSIFGKTKGKKKSKKKAASKKAGAKGIGKKAAVKKTASKKAASKKVAPKQVAAKSAPKAQPAAVAPSLEVNQFKALTTVLKNHEAEALYRKGKEDRILVLSCALLASLVFGVMIVLSPKVLGDSSWFGRTFFRLFFAGGAALVGLAGGSILELNRKRLQDVLAMTVKIHESLGFFTEGMFPTANGAYFPNTYKFIGSINDDETNYAQMIVKVAAAASVFAILLLS